MLFKRAKTDNRGAVGSFAHVDTALAAIRQSRDQGLEVRDVFAPVPIEELDELLPTRRSPVRLGTLLGAIGGCLGGLALGIGSAIIWNMVVGGKPVTDFVPFVVVAFELTILLGAGLTLLALLALARLPNRSFPGPAYRPEFSEDRFGVWVGCKPSAVDHVQTLLEDAGADEIYVTGDEPIYDGGEV